MIVVDVNIVAYRFIEGEKTGLACRLQEKDGDWALPPLWRHEFLNVLATTTRAGIIDPFEARELLRGAIQVLANREQAVDQEAALHLAVETGTSAYDAQYIALARSLRCPCVTEDVRLTRIFPQTAVSMRAFLGATR